MKKKNKKVSSDPSEINAFFGKDTEFNGKIKFQGAVRIDGNFTGEIDTDGVLILGDTAKVNAEIRTHTAIISGEVHGNIHALSMIEIHPPGKVFGKIQTPVLVIHEDVIFEGNSQMVGMEEGEEKKPKKELPFPEEPDEPKPEEILVDMES
jgi:cytoskeletal protein CcmA (bactofilin family)